MSDPHDAMPDGAHRGSDEFRGEDDISRSSPVGQSPRPRQLTLRTVTRGLLQDPITLASLTFLVAIVVGALIYPWVLPYDHTTQSLRARNLPPFSVGQGLGDPIHLLGTDQLGRDMLARILSAARVSLAAGFLSVIFSATIGITLGLIAGYRRGKMGQLIMRIGDLVMGIPFLLMALFVLFIFGTGLINVIIVLAVARWPLYTRVSQGMVLSLRETGYVEAARSLGSLDFWIIWRHVLPNMLSPMVVLATLEVARLILAEATLSFLGVGVQPPDSSWGLMISQGRDAMLINPWIVTLPGLFLFLTALSANLLATWVRTITDPDQRWNWLQGGHRRRR